MIKFRENTLLINAILLYAAYAVAAIFVVRPYVASTVAILAIMAGFVMFLRYFRKAWQILFYGERGDFGAHYAILGATELSIGVMYSGIYRALWNFMGTPHSWIGSAVGSLGLFMIVHGIYLMARSPETVIDGSRFPPYFWNNVIWGVLVIFAFFAGFQINLFVN